MRGIAHCRNQLTVQNVIKYFGIVPIRLVKVAMTYLLLIVCGGLAASNDQYKKWKSAVAILWVILLYMIAYMLNAWDSRMTHMLVLLPMTYWIMLNIGDSFEIDVRECVAFFMIFGVVLYNNFSSDIITSVEEKPMKEVVEDDISTEYLSAIDINSIMKQYSAYNTYSDALLKNQNVIILNGNYGIYPIYSEYMYNDELCDTSIFWYGGIMDHATFRIGE